MENEYNLLDKFINEEIPYNNLSLFGLSLEDSNKGKKLYLKMKNMNKERHNDIFCNNLMGYRSFSLYKSNKYIYFIVFMLKVPIYYVIIYNESDFNINIF
jgi:hypothetical protein